MMCKVTELSGFNDVVLINLAMEILKSKHDISKLEPMDTLKIFGAIYHELLEGMREIGPEPKAWLL